MALERYPRTGVRNSQVTLLAPCGTISFLMDCDTTGIEPDLALVKTKTMVGGGTLRIINKAVKRALKKLGYSSDDVIVILDYLEKYGMVEGAPKLQDEHLSVFDCSLEPSRGTRCLVADDHLFMMAAIQPLISGGISKTVNVPHECTPSTIRDIYVRGWKLGLKAISVYRDGCKRSQPMETSRGKKKDDVVPAPQAFRKRLPDTRQSMTHKFTIGGHEGYITAGLYDDGSPGEIFIIMSKEGSTISGLMDTIATELSVSLQYGVPLDVFTKKFAHMRFEPSGFTKNKEIPIAKSIVDYIFRWLDLMFGEGHYTSNGVKEQEDNPEEIPEYTSQADAPSCPACGNIMVRSGACYQCKECGETSGCS